MNAVTRLPDSALCRDALELATELEPAFLLNHSVRTFLLGRLIGRARDMPFDEELLLVAGVLHDVGLTERAPGAERFEVEGADAARALCRRHEVDPARADLVWDAIALHTSFGIPTRKEPEVALVHLGAGADLRASDLERVHQADVDAVMAAFPRLGGTPRFFGHLAEQLEAKPDSVPPFTLPAEVARAYIDGHRPVTLEDLLAANPYSD